MRCLILILCAVSLKVEASDWLNRTVRVDLIVDQSTINVRTFDPKFDSLVQSENILNAVNATNGQYPWVIRTTAWSDQGGGFRFGTPCAGTIINSNFVLSDFHCIGQTLNPPANSIEALIGFAQWNSSSTATHFVRSYWYIEPSPENRPNIVLFRMNSTITFNPNVHPIRLPFYQDFDYEGWSSLMLGFRSPDGPSTPHLQSMEASIFNNNQCDFDSDFADHDICAIDSGELYQGPIRRFNSFTGGAWIVYEYADAGLVFVPILVGIHQFQYANQTASFGRATRVSHFVEWIETLSAEN
ncbi:coagulation factor X-like [Bradysia coprophila]|uniref:coagulation factor X-like n=1 Tax=Bradysia coprophila TaxID=38358 RepID=UPI00187D7A1D|nr:coagulation factor X-like [Bradysia coprophila]